MCFYKTKESKVLVAKRNIVVYKIGIYADNTFFRPYYYSGFRYYTNQIVSETVEFTNMVEKGLHSYIMCELVPFATDMNLYSCGTFLYPLFVLAYAIYLGEFIIPKGTTYCLNNIGEVVSNGLIYTGNHIVIESGKQYNSKELWKEK